MFSFKLVAAAVVAMLLVLPNYAYCVNLREKPCCTPDQWESGIGLVAVGSQPYTTMQGVGSVSYDYTNQLLAMNETLVNAASGAVIAQRILLDGKAGKAYYVDLVTKHCVTSPMASIPQQCVPPNFNNTAIVTLGGSQERFGTLVFQGSAAGMNYTVSMTQKECAPVSQMTLRGNTGLSLESFYNFTLGIQDRSVFSIPSECKSWARFVPRSWGRQMMRSAVDREGMLFSFSWL